MIVGYPPFYHTDKRALFESISTEDPKYTKNISPSLKSLLQGLFIKNPSQRLGAKGFDDIKRHPWFTGMDWEGIFKKELSPPFVPIIKGDMDVSHFDTEFTE
mmetsp:Transcript_17260/g.15154  ORF Transcript_17260/g.15154 Transcript_17260/m.15154 type:complete len:102 (-) Transcript_17260:456-761(-)|eukprot:CAMPEP_0114598328 /NCGR_PEP_ID=MMETSP0125-20121206/20647_1 /TAXON_ID=485358 ORGANISM="Aristerostoma sp., Strain ATCC 50986" /NCGR_SAMPLE_ID=MMETSP0125 /ASSEMBLY_ACC=CAM_ASM_000245 /LENGTH=101 /DNA_ID=CAMNT_0001803847 /DNA_START=333 /DNA_END=638 /DNA_ORIENTATION=+